MRHTRFRVVGPIVLAAVVAGCGGGASAGGSVVRSPATTPFVTVSTETSSRSGDVAGGVSSADTVAFLPTSNALRTEGDRAEALARAYGRVRDTCRGLATQLESTHDLEDKPFRIAEWQQRVDQARAELRQVSR